MSLITVYTTFSSADAHLVRSRLEAAGLPAVIHNELAALNMGGYTQGAGGITVEVPEDRAAEARAIIESVSTSADNE
jgi:hypothetical protein